MRSVTVRRGLGVRPEVRLRAFRRASSGPACLVSTSRRASSAEFAKVFASRAASAAESALAVTARMLLSPSGVTLIASRTLFRVQSPPSLAAVRSAAADEWIWLPAVWTDRVGSPESRSTWSPRKV